MTKKIKKEVVLKKYEHKGISILPILVIILVIGIGAFIFYKSYQVPDVSNSVKPPAGSDDSTIFNDKAVAKLVKFKDDADYQKYLKDSQESASLGYYNIARDIATSPSAPSADLYYGVNDLIEQGVNLGSKDLSSPGASRVSTTNVQVVGIDEPDILKTDGQSIFYAGENPYYYGYGIESMPMMRSDRIMPPNYSQAKTEIIRAWPIADLKQEGSIEANGEMLLQDKNLMIFDQVKRGVYAYDVTDKANPKEKWHIKMEDNTTFLTSRLSRNSLYVVAQTYVSDYNPCPIKPLSVNDKILEIPCKDIYHPTTFVPIDSNLSILKIDPQTGEIKERATFVSSGYTTTVYMSSNNIYLTYNQEVNSLALMIDFMSNKASDIIPADIIEKLKKIDSYDISNDSKMNEFGRILYSWQSSLGKDEQLKLENNLSNRMQDYLKEHKRDLTKTAITKIDADKLELKSSGIVPGSPLSQYSLDEYQGNLRIATTIGGNWLNFGMGGSQSESTNDVYVLDGKMKIIGSVKDLGQTERIYSVRFINDRAYLVTFRQTDPFYILNLSDPKNPKMTGELKIPGFSNYLHPIANNMILGIGQENGQLKLSIFDVSDDKNPKEISKYTLSEYGSEVQYNPHAFLMDEKHKVFFIPGYSGSYIFSYRDNKLDLVKAVSEYNLKRAVYLQDYLYLVGPNKVVLINEADWQRIKDLDLIKK